MNKIFITLFLFFIQINLVSANANIAFIDMDKILSTSKPGLFLINQFEVIADENLNKFKNDLEKLKKQETKLISQKNILSEVDFNSQIVKFRSNVENHNKKKNKFNNDFNQLKINNTNKLLKLINPILIKYSNDKSIAMILQKKNLVIGQIKYDITDEIIKIINNEIAEFKVN